MWCRRCSCRTQQILLYCHGMSSFDQCPMQWRPRITFRLLRSWRSENEEVLEKNDTLSLPGMETTYRCNVYASCLGEAKEKSGSLTEGAISIRRPVHRNSTALIFSVNNL